VPLSGSSIRGIPFGRREGGGILVDVRILGPSEVRHDGSPVVLRGAKPRQLLVLLAIRANQPLPSEQLIEELWEENPPPSASTALRVHFGHLRHVLEPDRDPNTASVRLPAGPHGYVLHLEPDELDIERFERQVIAARQANAAGDPATAIPLITSALDLWRGQALVDVRDLSAARPELSRLDELHAIAFEELAEARLSLGEHALLVDVLTEAINKFPLREKLTASLMLAFYRAGRASDALRAYASLARRLDDQLGLVPTEPLRRLEEDILVQRPALRFDPRLGDESALYLRSPRIRMIGRHDEMRAIAGSFEIAAGERPRLGVVAGSAGIGKSTLIKEFCERAQSDGVRSAIGDCQLHAVSPYEPINSILEVPFQMPEHPPGFEPEDLSSSSASLEPLVEYVPDLDSRAARFRLFESVATRLAERHPSRSIVVIEDLHWAERPTLLMLRHLIRHPSLAHIYFIVSYRDDEVSGERLELIEQLAPPSLVEKCQLRPFHDSEVRALVRAIAAPENVELLVDHAAILRVATGGNPFYLRELLRELDDNPVKLETDDDVAAALRGLAPASARELIARRTGRLSPQGNALIAAAATLSEGISVDVLADVCSITREETLEAIEECLATRLLVEDTHDLDYFLFPHALVRNAVYVGIREDERIQLHKRIGRILVDRKGVKTHVAILARHFCEAIDLGGESEACEYSERAAIDAEKHLMFAEAVNWYQWAITTHVGSAGAEESLGRLYLGLARACANDRRLDDANEAFIKAAQQARLGSSYALLADIALTADGPWTYSDEFRETALPLLEEALSGLEDDDPFRRVRVLCGIASDLYYTEVDREGEVAREAAEVAASLHSPEATVTAMQALRLWTTHQPEARAERLALSRSAFETIEAEPGSEFRLLVQRSLLADLLENGHVGEFEAMLGRYESLAKEFGSPRDIYWSMALRSTEATLKGDLVAGEQLARGAALRGHELEQVSEGAYLLHRFVIRYQQGRLAEELPVLRQVGKARTVFRAGASLAAIAHSEMNHHDQALEIAWETLGEDGSALARDVFWLGAVALLGGVAARGGDRQLQDLVTGLLAPCAGHVVVFGAGGAVLGSARQWLGVLSLARGDLDVALACFSGAESDARQIGAPFWQAQAQKDAAAVRTARGGPGDLEEAARLLQAATAAATQKGFGRLFS